MMDNGRVNNTYKHLTHLDKFCKLRIIVLGYIVRGPLGGLAWHHLQYVIGLSRLGHDVYYIEDSDDYPSCYDPSRHITDTDPSYGLKFTASIFERLGLGDRWAYYDSHTSRWLGPSADKIINTINSSDIVFNISGVNPLRPQILNIPVRVLLDTDPVFTQIRHLTDPEKRKRALQHTAFFSFGENINTSQSKIPNDNFHWEPTRQPIILDAWQVTPGLEHGKFTTVMQWASYSAQEYNGKKYGMKSDSFEPYIDLPDFVESDFELALGSTTAPRELLHRKGWFLCDPLEVTRDPWTYQSYLKRSKAEFSVAKHGYVESRCGWFSERSAAYLASGRPVLIQDTGFSEWLESGAGVIPFNTFEEARNGVEEINSRYKFHCQAARNIAEEYFDARKVLPHLIECAMKTPKLSKT